MAGQAGEMAAASPLPGEGNLSPKWFLVYVSIFYFFKVPPGRAGRGGASTHFPTTCFDTARAQKETVNLNSLVGNKYIGRSVDR